jgi:hypothetical protein
MRTACTRALRVGPPHQHRRTAHPCVCVSVCVCVCVCGASRSSAAALCTQLQCANHQLQQLQFQLLPVLKRALPPAIGALQTLSPRVQRTGNGFAAARRGPSSGGGGPGGEAAMGAAGGAGGGAQAEAEAAGLAAQQLLKELGALLQQFEAGTQAVLEAAASSPLSAAEPSTPRSPNASGGGGAQPLASHPISALTPMTGGLLAGSPRQAGTPMPGRGLPPAQEEDKMCTSVKVCVMTDAGVALVPGCLGVCGYHR